MSGTPPRRAVTRILACAALSLLALTSIAGRPVGAQDTTTTTTAPATTSPPSTTTPTGGAPNRSSEVGLLDITSVTPWVTSDGEFQVRFGPTTQIPEGSKLTYTIHQALAPTKTATLRDQVNAAIDGDTVGKVLQTPETRPFAEYGDPTTGAVLTIPIRAGSGDADRALLPNAGIHPVELVLTPPEGPELWRQVVFLNRLPTGYAPAAGPADAPVAVTLLMPIETAPTLAPDGTTSFSIEQRASLDAASAVLRGAPEAPLTLGVRPNTLDGLARTGESWSDDLLSRIRNATGSASGTGAAGLLNLPYVHVDTGSLVAANAEDQLDTQIDLGAEVDAQVLGHQGSGAAWALDETLTPEALPTLAGRGVDTVVVAADALELPNGVTEQQTMSSAVELAGSQGLRAIAYDVGLSQRLTDTSVDPVVRAHEMVAMLMASWFTTAASSTPMPSPAAVILVPPTVDAATLTALEPSLDGTGPLLADTSAPILPAATGPEPEVELVRRDAPDERDAVAATEETARQIASYRSMVRTSPPRVELWDRLNAETLATALDAVQRTALHGTIRSQIAADIAKIEPPRARRVVLGSRDTTIPLRLRNELPYEVHLLLRAKSPRLDIDGGDGRVIVLAPGENVIDLPVVVQAPGESLLRIELATPDDGIQIASLDVPVRSTAISGVGAALSVVSVVFLILWWIHTHRRKRRESARAAGSHPSRPSDTDGPGEEMGDGPGEEPLGAVVPAGSAPDSTTDGSSTDSVT